MKINFKNWLAITEARFEDQAFASTDDPSREYGRQQNPIVAKIVEAKRGWKVELTPHKGFADTVLKIDGYFKSGELAGKSVQISARTAKNAGPDIAYKLTSKCSFHRNYGYESGQSCCKCRLPFTQDSR